MKNNATVPSLSIDGWVNTPLRSADFLFSHLFLADYSQTYLYYTHVKSIPDLIYKNQESISSLITDVKNTLDTYFGQYYETVNSEVTATETEGTSVTMNIFLELIEAGDAYTLSKVIEFSDSKVKSIIDYNNNG